MQSEKYPFDLERLELFYIFMKNSQARMQGASVFKVRKSLEEEYSAPIIISTQHYVRSVCSRHNNREGIMI